MHSRTMGLCLALAPNLATMTYASPYLISTQAVTYTMGAPKPAAASSQLLAQQRRTASVVMVGQEPPAQPQPRTKPAKMQAVAEAAAQQAVDTETDDGSFLVYKDNTWRATQGLTADMMDGELSDARLSTHTHEAEGVKEWEITSPITFQYRVRESADVLDPTSDTLIYGHLTDPHSLMRAKMRPLKRVVVVDDNVYALFGKRIDAYFAAWNCTVELLVLPTTEENKNMDLTLQIAEAIHNLGIDRRLDPVIAIGGGVCMDIVGFAASIYRRRTPYIRVPTTLMGYVDASVGAKSGINFSGKKNKLGAYLPPALSILDKRFLSTLPARQLSNGAAEIMKMAMVKDPELFDLLERHGPALINHKFQAIPDAGDEPPSRVLFLAIQTMLEELAPNLWEDSLERLVDFGHVFSMELEMAELHENKLFHGEAVAIDMAFCTVLAYVRGQITEDERDRLLLTMKNLGLPIFHPNFDENMCDEALYERVKFSSGQKIPLPISLGASRLFNDISMDQCREALALWPELV